MRVDITVTTSGNGFTDVHVYVNDRHADFDELGGVRKLPSGGFPCDGDDVEDLELAGWRLSRRAGCAPASAPRNQIKAPASVHRGQRRGQSAL